MTETRTIISSYLVSTNIGPAELRTVDVYHVTMGYRVVEYELVPSATGRPIRTESLRGLADIRRRYDVRTRSARPTPSAISDEPKRALTPKSRRGRS